MPVIMLTGADAEADVVRGLDAGANDYIAKPFRLPELLARVRAQLRVFDNSEDAVFTIGPYLFRPSAKLLLEPARNRKVRLTDKESSHPEVPVPGRRQAGAAADPAERGLGLQQRGDHPHAGDPYLPPAAEDRARPGQPALLLTDGGGYQLEPRSTGVDGGLTGAAEGFPSAAKAQAGQPRRMKPLGLLVRPGVVAWICQKSSKIKGLA